MDTQKLGQNYHANMQSIKSHVGSIAHACVRVSYHRATNSVRVSFPCPFLSLSYSCRFANFVLFHFTSPRFILFHSDSSHFILYRTLARDCRRALRRANARGKRGLLSFPYLFFWRFYSTFVRRDEAGWHRRRRRKRAKRGRHGEEDASAFIPVVNNIFITISSGGEREEKKNRRKGVKVQFRGGGMFAVPVHADGDASYCEA